MLKFTFSLFSLIIQNVFSQFISHPLSHWSLLYMLRNLYVPRSHCISFNILTMTIIFPSLFSKILLLLPAIDLSALISKSVPTDIYSFLGVKRLINYHSIMDSLIFPASTFFLFKTQLPQENFLNLEKQTQ